MKVAVFGCIGQPGHVWHPWDVRAHLRGRCPWPCPDGTLAPTLPAGLRDRREAPQGVAALHHKDGWTALSFWDRSGDHRGGSNTTFVVDETLDFDAMLSRAQADWPALFARFGFDVVDAAAKGGAR